MGSQSPGSEGGGDVRLCARPRDIHRLTGAGVTLSLLGMRRVTALPTASTSSADSTRPSPTCIALGHAPNLLSRSLGRCIIYRDIIQPLPVPSGGPRPNQPPPPRDLVRRQMMVRISRDKVPPGGEDPPLAEVYRWAGISRL
ncbi:hypothetical protein PIB30_003514 [Stylosanthes scabra]|uniref:Uncharacterized protein n=1 Tax=Stylosanthes scabra TaxID=79078 RepID=A0ABU6W2Y4_9FABA|nr:hypothetical protein [Stylosanthes scabra]